MSRVRHLAILLAFASIPGAACSEGASDPPAPALHLERDGVRVDLSTLGTITDVRDAAGRRWTRDGATSEVRVRVGASAPVTCERPSSVTQTPDLVTFEYDLRPTLPLRVRHALRLADVSGGVALERSVTLAAEGEAIREDVAVEVADPVAVPGARVTTFVPHQNGWGEESPARQRRLAFLLGGRPLASEGADRLAIPMTSEADEEGHRVTRTADPYFSTSFEGGGGTARIGWVYRGADVPLHGEERRLLDDVLHAGPPDEAMRAFYATALPDVPPGPSWLHDVLWQHYDYMSHGGRGWFEDIDAVSAIVPPEDRARVVFTLHGWFDVYGRYAFDFTTRRLRDAWTVFPNAAAVSADFPDLATMPMTKAEVHRRIAYARERGFRVALYFADGMATGEDVTELFRPERALYSGGWQGPDTTSPTWILNPAHPDVAAFFRDYLDALLLEFGAEIDALVWDETFHVRAGMVGPPEHPSYADRAMMDLTRTLTRRVSEFRADLAFLTSDAIFPGPNGEPSDIPPYALAAHGTYQDSWSRPDAWGLGLFPNFRNTLWSCNWRSRTNFAWTKIGVETVRAPVATSNGFLDNVGIARLGPEDRADLAALFAARKALGRQDLRWRGTP